MGIIDLGALAYLGLFTCVQMAELVSGVVFCNGVNSKELHFCCFSIHLALVGVWMERWMASVDGSVDIWMGENL